MPSQGHMNQRREVNTMTDFRQAMRAKGETDTVASSLYSVPASQAIDRVTNQRKTPRAVNDSNAHRQQHYETSQKDPMRLMTRNGDVLQAQPSKKPEVQRSRNPKYDRPVRRAASEVRPHTAQSKSSSVRRNHNEALNGLEGRPERQYSPPPWMSPDDFQNVAQRRQQIVDRKTRQLEAYHRSIGWSPRDDVMSIGPIQNTAQDSILEEPVIGPIRPNVQRHPSNTSASAQNLLRRLSNSVKGVFRSSSEIKKRRISQPFDFRDGDPNNADPSTVHPQAKAIPVRQAQRRFSYGYKPKLPHENVRQTPVSLRHVEAQQLFDDVVVERSTSMKQKGKQPDRRAPAQQQPTPAPTRQLRVVGDPDHDTLFGDFIDAAQTSDLDLQSDAGYIDIGYQQAQEAFSRPDLAPAPLTVPKRKPVEAPSALKPRLVDIPPRKPVGQPANVPERRTSGSDRRRQERRASGNKAPVLPKPARVTSAHDWEMEAEYPAVDDLFDPIDEMVANSSIISSMKPQANREAHRLMAKFARPAPGTLGVDEEDAEPEIEIDTYDRGSHIDWIATERPDRDKIHSDRGRFQSQQYDSSRDADEAAEMMERLRRMRMGEPGPEGRQRSRR